MTDFPFDQRAWPVLRRNLTDLRCWRSAACWLLGLLLLTGPATLAAADASAEPQIVVGYDGVYQVGRWTPVRVRPAPGQTVREVTVTAVDVDGRPVAFSLPSRSDGSFSGVFQTGRLDAPIRVTLSPAEGTPIERFLSAGREHGLESLRQDTRLWMAVGSQAGFQLGADLLNNSQPEAARAPRVRVLPTRLEDLPNTADALDSVHALVLGPESLSDEQSTAVRDWVQRGGRLVLIVGSGTDRYQSSPLSKWLPVRVEAAYEERQTAALTGRITAYVPNKGILRSLDPLRVARLAVPSGQVLIDGPTAPVAVRCAYGLGIITVVGLDLESSPFIMRSAGGESSEAKTVHWGGLPLMCVQLAGESQAAVTGVAVERQLQLSPTGVSDIASQLGGILDHFPEVDRASSWNVIGLLAVYLLLVGPIDYLLVHRVLRRPQLTWVTLPAWILLASWYATALASAGNGDRMVTRQIDVLDVAIDTGVQRLSTWFSLYSPETRRHTVEWQAVPEANLASGRSGVRLAPIPRPEEGFRGMYRRGGIHLGGAGYQLEGEARSATAMQVPVDQWSSLVWSGESVNLPPEEAPPLATCLQVTDTQGVLRRFELTHHLPGELEDWFVVQRMETTFPMSTGVAPHKLVPGETHNLIRGCGQKLLKAYIQGELTTTIQRKTGVDTYIRSDVYDPLGRDPLVLFRALSFHEAIGGGGFTQLTNHTLDRLDFSPTVHLDRLIVFGRLTRPLAAFQVDGTAAEPEEQPTFVRLLVPITRETVAAPPDVDFTEETTP